MVVSSHRSSMRRSTAGSPNSGTFSTAVRARAVGSTSAGRSRATLPYDLDRGNNRCAARGHARVGALVAAEAKWPGDSAVEGTEFPCGISIRYLAATRRAVPQQP